MRKPERITLLEIVESVEGKPSPSVLSPVHANQRAAIAVVNRLCEQNAKRFVAELRQVRLSDLILREASTPQAAKSTPEVNAGAAAGLQSVLRYSSTACFSASLSSSGNRWPAALLPNFDVSK